MGVFRALPSPKSYQPHLGPGGEGTLVPHGQPSECARVTQGSELWLWPPCHSLRPGLSTAPERGLGQQVLWGQYLFMSASR